jgi:hypothetical protein
MSGDLDNWVGAIGDLPPSLQPSDVGAATESASKLEVWHSLTASVRGASHRRTGLPNQDAVRVWRSADRQLQVLAMADGHGSVKSFRSRQGARLAVAVALSVGARLPSCAPAQQRKRWAKDAWPTELVRGWQSAVDRRLDRQPISEAELGSLDAAARAQVAASPRLAFGSTLLSVILTREAILYLQIGDGDLLTVSADGTLHRPLPPDPRLIANETTSLCAANAWQEARVYCQTLAGAPPALILAATDGYANAFRDDAGFRQVALDLWSLLREEGRATLAANLRGWLTEASEQGSGDDISVGLLWRAAEGATPSTAPPVVEPDHKPL